MHHQTKSNNQMQAQACGNCGSTKINDACPRGCKKEAKVPAWMAKSMRRMELNNQ